MEGGGVVTYCAYNDLYADTWRKAFGELSREEHFTVTRSIFDDDNYKNERRYADLLLQNLSTTPGVFYAVIPYPPMTCLDECIYLRGGTMTAVPPDSTMRDLFAAVCLILDWKIRNKRSPDNLIPYPRMTYSDRCISRRHEILVDLSAHTAVPSDCTSRDLFPNVTLVHAWKIRTETFSLSNFRFSLIQYSATISGSLEIQAVVTPDSTNRYLFLPICLILAWKIQTKTFSLSNFLKEWNIMNFVDDVMMAPYDVNEIGGEGGGQSGGRDDDNEGGDQEDEGVEGDNEHGGGGEGDEGSPAANWDDSDGDSDEDGGGGSGSDKEDGEEEDEENENNDEEEPDNDTSDEDFSAEEDETDDEGDSNSKAEEQLERERKKTRAEERRKEKRQKEEDKRAEKEARKEDAIDDIEDELVEQQDQYPEEPELEQQNQDPEDARIARRVADEERREEATKIYHERKEAAAAARRQR